MGRACRVMCGQIRFKPFIVAFSTAEVKPAVENSNNSCNFRIAEIAPWTVLCDFTLLATDCAKQDNTSPLAGRGIRQKKMQNVRYFTHCAK